MRILILGWADIAAGSLEGGGYNLVAQEHVNDLVDQGHDVYYLKSGVDFSFLGRNKVKYTGLYNGVRCYSYYNSQNFAPGIFNISNVDGQYRDDQQNLLIGEFIEKNRISRVFFHSYEGYNLSLIPYLKSHFNVSISVFCHDHFFICPQVNLLCGGMKVCDDYLGGERCLSCMPPGFGEKYKLNRIIESSPFKFLLDIKRSRIKTSVSNISCSSNENLFNALDVLDRRRETIRDMLNMTDDIYTPSTFIKDYLLGIGVNNVTHVRIGLPHLDKLSTLDRCLTSDKIRFCFRGTDKPLKGVSIFLEAIKLMEDDLYPLCEFHIYGVSKDFIETYNLSKSVELYIGGRYNIDDICNQKDYDYGLLSHLWYENSPITMLEHLALGKPVISSLLGGVTDYIKDGENGYFYKAGDVEVLSELLKNIILGNKSIKQLAYSPVNDSDSFFEELI